MRTLGDLSLVPVWVNPGHRVSSARYLLEGHRLRAIAVLEGTELVGIVSADRIETCDEVAVVSSVMKPAKLVLQANLPVPKAAQIFIEEEVDFAPVMDEDQFLGILTAHTLLRELRRSWDPLTNLGWSDRLREWGVETLKSGREITLLFFDLDNFGDYNKIHGHIVGDRVLRRMAMLLKECVDKDQDVLVRYGGDEFVIGTSRTRENAEALVERISDQAAATLLDDLQHPIGYSVGLAGGRRTRERENVHFAATFDELINSASKDCMAKKREKMARIASRQSASVQPEPQTVPPSPTPEPQVEPPTGDVDFGLGK